MPKRLDAIPALPHAYVPNAIGTPIPGVALPKGVPIAPLGLNESCFGASPAAIAATKARSERLWIYPDPTSTALRNAIGKTHDLPPEGIVCGNGSEELIDVIARVYARPGDEILYPEFGFMQFPVVAIRVGANPVAAPECNHVIDIDALLSRVTPRTRIVFIANPNNPTSTMIGRAAVNRLADALPSNVVLVIDAAYAEYAIPADYTAGHELVAGRHNVVVLRTFSKAYGLAALRVGWAHCAPDMAAHLNQVRGVGNINALAQEAAIAALGDPDFTSSVRPRNALMRDSLASRYRALGLQPLDGQANFLAVRFPDQPGRRASDAHALLASRGIWVRRLADCGMPDFLRITIGVPADNERLFEALAALGS